MIALVLSGGGAKGAFQAGAIQYLEHNLSESFGVVAGVSVGALNGAMVAMNRTAELVEIWEQISNDKVFSGKITAARAGWALLRKKNSILDTGPLRRMITEQTASGRIKVPFLCGLVNLDTGEFYYHRFEPKSGGALKDLLVEFVLASAAMPVLFPPVEIGGGLYVDGGIRTISPLSAVMDMEPDHVYIINTSPRNLQRSAPRTMPEIFDRALMQIAMSEIAYNDLSEILRINSLVKQAADKGLELTKPNGKPYKYFNVTLIEPAEPLRNTLDFDGAAADLETGYLRAKQILNRVKKPI